MVPCQITHLCMHSSYFFFFSQSHCDFPCKEQWKSKLIPVSQKYGKLQKLWLWWLCLTFVTVIAIFPVQFNARGEGAMRIAVCKAPNPWEKARSQHHEHLISKCLVYNISIFLIYFKHFSFLASVSKWIWWTDFQKNIITISEITSLQWVKTSQGAR